MQADVNAEKTFIIKLVRGWLDHIDVNTHKPISTAKARALRMAPAQALVVANNLTERGIYALVVPAES